VLGLMCLSQTTVCNRCEIYRPPGDISTSKKVALLLSADIILHHSVIVPLARTMILRCKTEDSRDLQLKTDRVVVCAQLASSKVQLDLVRAQIAPSASSSQSACQRCPANTFKTGSGSHGCTECARGTFSREGAAVCCGPGSFLGPGNICSASCPAGYGFC